MGAVPPAPTRLNSYKIIPHDGPGVVLLRPGNVNPPPGIPHPRKGLHPAWRCVRGPDVAASSGPIVLALDRQLMRQAGSSVSGAGSDGPTV